MSAERQEMQFKQEFDDYVQKKRNLKKLYDMRNNLTEQLTENTIVQIELGYLKPTAEVYKKVGPVLLPQNQRDAKDNVAKRLKYIEREMTRIIDHIKSSQVDLDNRTEKLKELQAKLVKNYNNLLQLFDD